MKNWKWLLLLGCSCVTTPSVSTNLPQFYIAQKLRDGENIWNVDDIKRSWNVWMRIKEIGEGIVIKGNCSKVKGTDYKA